LSSLFSDRPCYIRAISEVPKSLNEIKGTVSKESFENNPTLMNMKVVGNPISQDSPESVTSLELLSLQSVLSFPMSSSSIPSPLAYMSSPAFLVNPFHFFFVPGTPLYGPKELEIFWKRVRSSLHEKFGKIEGNDEQLKSVSSFSSLSSFGVIGNGVSLNYPCSYAPSSFNKIDVEKFPKSSTNSFLIPSPPPSSSPTICSSPQLLRTVRSSKINFQLLSPFDFLPFYSEIPKHLLNKSEIFFPDPLMLSLPSLSTYISFPSHPSSSTISSVESSNSITAHSPNSFIPSKTSYHSLLTAETSDDSVFVDLNSYSSQNAFLKSIGVNMRLSESPSSVSPTPVFSVTESPPPITEANDRTNYISPIPVTSSSDGDKSLLDCVPVIKPEVSSPFVDGINEGPLSDSQSEIYVNPKSFNDITFSASSVSAPLITNSPKLLSPRKQSSLDRKQSPPIVIPSEKEQNSLNKPSLRSVSSSREFPIYDGKPTSSSSLLEVYFFI
jgi:hypothetical protein